jgi:MFS family permease
LPRIVGIADHRSMSLNRAPTRPATVSGSSGRPIVPALALVTLASALGSSLATVSLPTLVAEFGVPLGVAQWVTLAYLLIGTVLVLPVGPLGDQLGRRRVLLFALAVFNIAAVLAVVAPSLGWLIGARGVQGGAAAVMTAMAMALVRESVPADRIGRTMGTLGATTAAGMALGPEDGGRPSPY